jgi:hypothetical protein
MGSFGKITILRWQTDREKSRAKVQPPKPKLQRRTKRAPFRRRAYSVPSFGGAIDGFFFINRETNPVSAGCLVTVRSIRTIGTVFNTLLMSGERRPQAKAPMPPNMLVGFIKRRSN